MAQIDKVYSNHIHKHRDYYSNWPPSKTFTLGDYGEWKGGTFDRVGNIASRFKIKLVTGAAGTAQQLEAISKSAFTTKASAGVKAGQIKGDVDLTFKKKNEVYFKAQGIKHYEIKNIDAVSDRIVQLTKAKRWLTRYVIVTEIVDAEHFIAMVSTKAGGKVTLSGKAPVKGVDIDIRNFTIKWSSSAVDTFEDHDGGTPLFQLHKLKGIGKARRLAEYK